MSTPEVQIITLAPLRVASAWGFGPQPETIAMERLLTWAKARGLLDGPTPPRIFGFNNPSPAPGSPNYGYELWIEVGQAVEPEGDIRIQSFAGGRYAVMPLADPDGDPSVTIPAGWRQLDAWVADSPHQPGSHQCLEQHSAQGQVIALYYQIAD